MYNSKHFKITPFAFFKTFSNNFLGASIIKSYKVKNFCVTGSFTSIASGSFSWFVTEKTYISNLKQYYYIGSMMLRKVRRSQISVFI